MFKSYLRTAATNLARHKSYAFITLSGLVLGMTSCILILLYVLDELRYDRWIPEAEAVYRYETVTFDPAGTERLSRRSALRAARDLQQYFPEVEAATRMIDHAAVLGGGDREYFETVWFADRGFMDVFRLPLLQGAEDSVLADKSSLLISAQAAAKYFPGQQALGQVLVMDGVRDLRVSGVFADVPAESHISPEFVVLYDETDPQYNFGYSESWSAVEGFAYVRLRPGADADAINGRLPEFRQRLSPDFVVPAGRQFADVLRPRLINVLDIHLDAGGIGNIKPPGSRQMLVTLSLIAGLVLAIACFNFVNLSTVRALTRAREASVRKAIGAARTQLLGQFLLESVVVSLLALAISLSLAEVLLPWYNGVLGREITLDYISVTTLLLVCGAALLGVCSGLYPAYRVASWQPANLLRSGTPAPGGGWVQAVLVVGQFAISSTLVITTLVVLMQQRFIANTDPGYSTDRKLVIRNVNEQFARDSRELFTAGLAAVPGVLDTTFAAAVPGDLTGASFYTQFTTPGRDAEFPLYPKAVGANFFDVYAMPLVSGRAFSEDLQSDRFAWPQAGATDTSRAAAILNESAVAAAGFASAEDAIGSTVAMPGMELAIVGVVPDVNFQSLRSAITPNLYIYSPQDFVTLTVAYAPGTDEGQLVAEVSELWQSLVPDIPLAFEFLEDNIARQYVQDRLQFLLITIAAGLAVSIACMGLFALAAFSTRRRTREISLRKIHGALRTDIVGLLLLQFSRPVLLATVLSWPFALYAITRYLDGFQYRIEPGPAVFIVAALGLLSIAWTAIILHVNRAASARPAVVLKQEC